MILVRLPEAVRACLLILVLVAGAFVADRQGALAPVDRALLDFRASLTHRDLSGEVVFVQIDAKSLEAVGEWPWARSVHARILDRLVEAGATDIFIDVDFAFPADAAGDQDLADALDRAGGTTYLPIFKQAESIGEPGRIHYNRPMPDFAARSWPVFANVSADAAGLIRTYPHGAEIDGEFVPSAGSALASRYTQSTDSFQIDYARDPKGIPTVSAADLIGETDIGEVLRGRSVVVGASAVELGDYFAVPVHGVIPGAMIHILATETLLADTAPVPLRSDLLLAALALMLVALQLTSRRGLWVMIGALVVCHVGSEAVALALFRQEVLVAPTAFLHPALLTFALIRLAVSLQVTQWLSRRKDDQIQDKSQLLTHVFDDSSDAIVIADESGNVLMQSHKAEVLFGLSPEGTLELPGKLASLAAREAVSEDPPEDGLVHQSTIVKEGQLRFVEFSLARSVLKGAQGDDVATDAPQKIVTMFIRDVTQLREQERHIAYLSNHDERTGALRRNAFLPLLEHRAGRGECFAIFVLNLHRFKAVNLSMGRDAGDALLREVVRRLESTGRPLSAVMRVDGDRFAFYTETPCDDAQAVELARWIVDYVSAPYDLDEGVAQIGAQVGYDLIEPGAPFEPANALARAEEALDDARALGGSRVRRYDPVSSERRLRTREIEREMSDALERGEFYLTYQPQHRLSDGVLTGVEALVRWENPRLGSIGPDEFIPIAEANGFIIELGRWVLDRATQDALRLPDDVVMAVNVSGCQMLHGEIDEDVRRALAASELPPERLCLELTESVLITPTSQMVETMHDIRWSGVTWALDDFGTGFSSLTYLSTLPLNKLKLDKAFTMNLENEVTNVGIVRSAEVLCRGLGLTILCEGVDSDAQLGILKDLGCDEGQGFLFGRPMRMETLLRQLSEGARPNTVTPQDA